ncbi:MAG TPA: sugar phosphate nucleotidyltransferase [Candidatus Acidoferrum sp.]
MILAAGLGTRLRPLTNDRPKALVELNGRTLLEIALTRLQTFGVTEAIINVHHFAEMIIAYLKSKNNFNMHIEISREDDQLLDTGGGLKKAAWFFQETPTHPTHVAQGEVREALRPSPNPKNDAAPQSEPEPFLLHNVDIISTIDLTAMLEFHKQNQALATLAVQSRPTSRQLLFNDQLQLSGRRINNYDTIIPLPQDTVISPLQDTVMSSEARNLSSPSSRSPLTTHHSPLPRNVVIPSGARNPLLSPLHPLAFSGVHILSPRLLPLITETGAFSIIDTYLRLSSQGQKILAFRHDNSYWRDLGKPADLEQAALDLEQGTLL